MIRSITDTWEISQDKPTPIDVVRGILNDYPLCKSEHDVFYKEDNNNIYLNWNSGNRLHWISSDTGRFDLQITNKVCYLLHIEIAEEHRHKGLGFLLYLLIEEIARELGCHTIVQTPSGWTDRNLTKTRMEYVCDKLGYTKKGIEAEKDICPDGLLPTGDVCPRCGRCRIHIGTSWWHKDPL